MELLFLGTSAGAPTRQRNVSACALRCRGQRAWCLIDCGEGTQHRLLATELSLRSLAAICVTHVHGDHTFGLPGVLASAQMAGRTEPLTILAPQGVREFVDAALHYSASYLGFAVEWIEVSAALPACERAGLSIRPVALSHRVPSFAYCLSERQQPGALDHARLKASGLPPGPDWARIKAGEDVTLTDGQVLRAADFLQPAKAPRCIIVAGDNDQPERLTQACAQAQVLVHEATYTQAIADKVGPAPQHSSALSIARFAQQVGLPNLVLNHFSGRYSDSPGAANSIEEIRSEAASHYRGTLFLARDYAAYLLDKDGRLHESPAAATPGTP